MVARCTYVKVDPADVEACVELFNQEVVPAASELEGFKGVMLLVHPDDGEAVVIDLCETRELALSNEHHGFYQREIARFADRLIGTPRRVVYDVRTAEGIAGGPELLEAAG